MPSLLLSHVHFLIVPCRLIGLGLEHLRVGWHWLVLTSTYILAGDLRECLLDVSATAPPGILFLVSVIRTFDSFAHVD